MSDDCPHCGAPLPPRARSCRECGSDARTGWRPAEEIDYESVELPDEEDDEAALVREGLGPRGPRGRRAWISAIAAALLAAAIVAALVFH